MHKQTAYLHFTGFSSPSSYLSPLSSVIPLSFHVPLHHHSTYSPLKAQDQNSHPHEQRVNFHVCIFQYLGFVERFISMSTQTFRPKCRETDPCDSAV